MAESDFKIISPFNAQKVNQNVSVIISIWRNTNNTATYNYTRYNNFCLDFEDFLLVIIKYFFTTLL